VAIEAADGRVAKEDAATAVGLESVLVGIYDDGVGLIDGLEGGAGGGIELVGDKTEVPAVCGIDVNAEAVTVAESEDCGEWVDGAEGGGAEGDDDGAYIAQAELIFESVEVHAAGIVAGDRGKGQAENGADAVVGVVSLIGREDAFAGMELAGHPEGLKIGEGSAGGEVAEMLGEAEHASDFRDRLDFHLGAGAAAVAGVVVGVDGHGEGVSSSGDGVGRLEHLAGVEGMEVGIVVLEAVSDLVEDGFEGCELGLVHPWLHAGKVGKMGGETLVGSGDEAGKWIGMGGVRHGNG
jgi:hypothetical protein